MRVIVLGSTGHVGKNMVYHLRERGHEVLPFSRSGADGSFKLIDFGWAPAADLLVNCIGVGSPDKEKEVGETLYWLENEWDDNCIDYLAKHSGARYVYFSSGIVHYGENSAYYRTKRAVETKHSLCLLPITDIRLYSFFSRFIDIENTQLVPSIIRAIKNKRAFEYDGSVNVYRDYILPEDLATEVELVGITCHKPPRTLDVSSGKPTDKFSIIEMFKKDYGLEARPFLPATKGRKCYTPPDIDEGACPSLEAIAYEARLLLGE